MAFRPLILFAGLALAPLAAQAQAGEEDQRAESHGGSCRKGRFV